MAAREMGVYQIPRPGAVARVDYYGQVAKLLNDRHRGQVHRETGVGLKGAYASFAKHHLAIPTRKNIFSGQEPLFVRG